MGNIFFISDTHFGDKKVWKIRNRRFKKWKTVHKMDEALIKNWNKEVKKGDIVYHLGDVAVTKKGLALLNECNGKKILIKGNHDEYPISEYLKVFDDIHGIVRFEKYFLSHTPIHASLLPKWCKANIHGHIHHKQIDNDDGQTHHQYYNISVERTNFTPIALEEINLNVAAAHYRELFRIK
jgi:calcineurin-like phosphoesterase family protein